MDQFRPNQISQQADRLYKRGTKDGGQNLPEKHKTSPTLEETKIITFAKQCVAAEGAIYSKAILDVEQRASNLEQTILENNASCAAMLEHPLDNTPFDHVLAKHEHELVTTCAEYWRTRAELNAFTQEHGLQRTAHYPNDRLLHFAWLVAFVAIETGVNAFL